MAEHPAENELNIKDQDRIPAQDQQLGMARIGHRLGPRLDPIASGTYRNGNGYAKEGLTYRGVCGRNLRR